MTLDVVIPTYNRSRLVAKTIASLFRAARPAHLDVTLIVVDNNSTDDTKEVVEALAKDAPLPIRYVLETTQGSSAARNTGVDAGTSQLVGFVDDDEEIAESWFCAIAHEFQDASLDYIGGPCLPDREIRYPDWLPPGYHSAIGVTSVKPRGEYGPGHPGMLNGGNAVLRRRVLASIGPFSPYLGRSSRKLLSEEDAELFRRLLRGGYRGVYVPELVILHHVHPNRLTRRYHRLWVYWRAVSQGVLDRHMQEPVSYLLGVPRYRIGRAFRSLASLPADRWSRGKGQAFADELACWDLVGFIYGKYLFREESHYRVERALTSPARN